MAKLRPQAIQPSDIEEYIEKHSVFAFELSVYKQLLDLGFECELGGAYADPLTQKIRQFDIRAVWTDYDHHVFPREQIRLAVECKALQDSFPLVIHTVPRKRDECLHDFLVSVDTKKFGYLTGFSKAGDPIVLHASQLRVRGKRSIYNNGDPVGKTCAQVGRDLNGTITASDSETFSKWTQAISSAQSLTDQACLQWQEQGNGAFTILIVPVVVVPNACLWCVHFGDEGTPCAPEQVERCSYWIDSTFEAGDGKPLTSFPFVLSHLEFVTANGLESLVTDLKSENRESYLDRQEVRRMLGLNT